MNLQLLGGRRFLLTIGCGLVTSILVWEGRIGDAAYASIIIATVGAYITGNVISEVKGASSAKEQ